MFNFKINKYLVSSLWYMVAIGVGYSIAFIGSIVFTHLMDTNSYGLYTTYYSIVSLSGPFVCGNLFIGLQNGYFDFKENRTEFRSSVFFLSLIIFLIISFICFFICCFINKFTKYNYSELLLLIALIHSFSFFVINYFNTYENLNGNYKLRSVLIILQNVLPVLFSIIFIIVFARNSYYERIFGSTSPLLIISFILGFIIFKSGNQFVNKEYYRYALKISIPSMLGSISSLAMSNVDNIMITSMVSADATAVYGFMYNIGNVLVVVLSAVSASVTAWVYNALDTKRTEAARTGQKWYYLFFVLIICMLLMIFPEFIKLFTPEEYWDFRYIVPFVFACSLSVVNALHCDIINYNKKTGMVSLCVAVSAGINVILNYFFIKKFGAIAAAYTSLLSMLVQTVLYRIVLKRTAENIFSDLYSILYIIMIFMMCVFFIFVYNSALIRYTVYSFIIICLIAVIVCKRHNLLELIKN